MALCGCLSAAPKAPRNWLVEWDRAQIPSEASRKAAFGLARLSSVAVRAPYDTSHIAVLRDDGTVAFDPCNTYAASPAQLLRGAAADALSSSGVFERVLPSGSAAAADVSVEIVVRRLALDCRSGGAREALVEIETVILDARSVVAAAGAQSRVDASEGDYSAAFSRAFAQAVRKAAADLARK